MYLRDLKVAYIGDCAFGMQRAIMLAVLRIDTLSFFPAPCR
jgi:hypothetical protein